MVLLCEHASNDIPPEYAGQGLELTDLGRHIAWDIGVAEVVRHLSRQLDAPAFLGTYSRLLIDLNRPLHAASSIVTRSEATGIPGNVPLTPAERESRAARFFRPFHNAVEQHLAARGADGQPTVIVTVHSFTPTYHGVARPWHAGVLYEKAANFAHAAIERLSASGDGSLQVGHNVPYCPSPDEDYGLLIYGDNVGNPAILIEIRRDDLHTVPHVPLTLYRDGFGNWCTRLVTPPGQILVSADAVIRDTDATDPVVPEAAQHAVATLPEDLIARGRDAADVAISTTFGPNTLERFLVWTDEVAAA